MLSQTARPKNAVKLVKNLISKAQTSNSDVFLPLLEQTNIPTEGIGTSPVQRLFGRRTRTLLPLAANRLDPAVPTDVVEKLKERKIRQKQYYDRQSRPLPDLAPGDTVRVHPVKPGKVWFKARVEWPAGPRSYYLRTEEDQCYRRNRRHLRRDRTPSSSS